MKNEIKLWAHGWQIFSCLNDSYFQIQLHIHWVDPQMNIFLRMSNTKTGEENFKFTRFGFIHLEKLVNLESRKYSFMDQLSKEATGWRVYEKTFIHSNTIWNPLRINYLVQFDYCTSLYWCFLKEHLKQIFLVTPMKKKTLQYTLFFYTRSSRIHYLREANGTSYNNQYY